MKQLFLLLFTGLVLVSCTNDSEQSLKEKELELKERELAIKEKEMELNQNGQEVSNNTSSKSSVNTKNVKLSSNKSEAELKRELIKKECANPLNYLKGKLTVSAKFKNLLSTKVDGAKLNCTVRNNASFATYKNLKAQVTFKSHSGATILRKEFYIYEFIPARTTRTFKREIPVSNQQWKDTDTYDWKILDAKCN